MSDQIVAIAHYPDGEPVRGVGHFKPNGAKAAGGGDPLSFLGRSEERAIRSALRAFWNPRKGRPGMEDLEGPDLVGATIRIAGEVVARYAKRIVTDAAGKVIDVVYEWLDTRAELAEAKRAAELAAAQAEVDAAAKPKRGKAE